MVDTFHDERKLLMRGKEGELGDCQIAPICICVILNEQVKNNLEFLNSIAVHPSDSAFIANQLT